MNSLLQSLDKTFKECYTIAEKKNKDYAGVTGKDPFAKFRAVELIGLTPEQGILTRIIDKIKRVSNLLTQENFVTEESIDDTINDAINYLAILKAFRQEKLNESNNR